MDVRRSGNWQGTPCVAGRKEMKMKSKTDYNPKHQGYE
jgi:hypothetical protein